MRPFTTPLAALEFEIAQETASALGRLGRRLEGALAALRSFDAKHHEIRDEKARERRERLVAEAGEALWYLMVQRDACGLHNSASMMTDYRIPGEVVNRVGPAG
jgi:hypothetical protein